MAMTSVVATAPLSTTFTNVSVLNPRTPPTTPPSVLGRSQQYRTYRGAERVDGEGGLLVALT